MYKVRGVTPDSYVDPLIDMFVRDSVLDEREFSALKKCFREVRVKR